MLEDQAACWVLYDKDAPFAKDDHAKKYQPGEGGLKTVNEVL